MYSYKDHMDYLGIEFGDSKLDFSEITINAIRLINSKPNNLDDYRRLLDDVLVTMKNFKFKKDYIMDKYSSILSTQELNFLCLCLTQISSVGISTNNDLTSIRRFERLKIAISEPETNTRKLYLKLVEFEHPNLNLQNIFSKDDKNSMAGFKLFNLFGLQHFTKADSITLVSLLITEVRRIEGSNNLVDIQNL